MVLTILSFKDSDGKEIVPVWKIFESDSCLTDFLNTLPANQQKNGRNLLSLIEDIYCGRRDPRSLPDDVCHEVRKNPKIWNLIKGDLRVLFFYDRDKVIVCAKTLIKDSQKLPEHDIGEAEKVYSAYQKTKMTKNLKGKSRKNNGNKRKK